MIQPKRKASDSPKGKIGVFRFSSFLIALCLLLAACGLPAEDTTTLPDDVSTVDTSGENAKEQPSIDTTEDPELMQEETTEPAKPDDTDFVRVLDYIPGIFVDLKYATTDNFTGQVIYEFSDVYLRYGTVKKLALVQEELRSMGLSLKLWDGFRPVAAQFALWEICPDPVYVANPNTGFSSHSRGNTVDITLVDEDGRELAMPTGFDDFTALANRDYSDCPQEAASNARMLETLMERFGFAGYYGEWWHFSDSVKYEVEHEFYPPAK